MDVSSAPSTWSLRAHRPKLTPHSFSGHTVMPMKLLMTNQLGQRAPYGIRPSRRGLVREHLELSVVLAVVLICCAALIALLPIPSTVRSFWAGFVVATALAGLAWVRHSTSTARRRSPREFAEAATADAVAGWRRRRSGWRVINGIYIAGHGAIAHVLIGPGGVFVIESKWTSNTCRIECGEIVGLLGRVPVAQAGNAAVKIERLLREGQQHLNVDVEVRPLIVIWGSGGLNLHQGSTDIDGVLVCEGRRQKDWLPQLEGTVRLSPASVDHITRTLEHQVSPQGAHPSPGMRTWLQRKGSLLLAR